MFIDSHCHLQLFDYTTSLLNEASLIAAAQQQQVEQILSVATNLDQYQQLKDLCSKYPLVRMSIGLHPNEIIAQEPTEATLLAYLTEAKIVAIGETGLDYFRQEITTPIQQQRFRTQIRVARQAKKPLIIHTRNAETDTIRILSEEHASDIGGVFHCFTGDKQLARQALDLNFAISFSGIVTFAKAQTIQEVAQWLPLDKLLLETDAPWLAPVPFRGQINQPAYLRHIAEYIAKLRGIDLAELAAAVRQNYYRIFGT